MQDDAAIVPMLAIFGFGDSEIVLILALTLLLFGSRHLPNLARGLGEGFREFKKAFWNVTRDISEKMDGEASDAGRSIGGIYGKPAAQAITSDNHVAELYEPAAFQKDGNGQRKATALFKRWFSFFRQLGNFWRKILRRFFPNI